MEISLQSRLIQAARAARPKSAEIEETQKTKTAASAQASRTDSVNLTDPTAEMLRKQSERLRNLLERPVSQGNEAFDWEQAARNTYNEAEGERVLSMRCQEISRRIARGDTVPPEDEQYLAENDPDAFKLSYAMRAIKKHPKVWKSVLKDEKYQPHFYENGDYVEESAAPQESGTDSAANQAVEKLREQGERLRNLLEQSAETAQPLAIPPAPWEASSETESSDETDAMAEQLKSMKRCMEIARRIMRGDKVPPEDMEYLMQNDPNGFRLAMAMRTPKKHPKEWESVLKGDKKSEQSNEGGGEEAASTESCGASDSVSGGGTSDTGGSKEK